MDAEEFHKSRRTGRGLGERRGKGTKDRGREGESESQQLRRRSYAPREELVDVDPTTGEDKPGGGREDVAGRTRPSHENPVEIRDGDRGGGRGGNEGMRHALGAAFGGGEGACEGCGRCSCCGRVAFPFMKDAFDSSKGLAEGAKDANDEGGRPREGGGRGTGRGDRRVPGGSGHRTSESSDERHYRHSPDLQRDYDFGARRRDRGEGHGHEMAATGHRSDPSAGRGEKGCARRRRRRRSAQRQDGGREDDHHRYHREAHFDGHQRPEVEKDGRRHQRMATGYSGGDVSNEEEHMSPRRRRARREAAVTAAANSATEAARVGFGHKEDFARHRRREKQGSDGGGVAFSTPFSTPRRGQPAAAPPKQHLSTWRGDRRDGRGRGIDNRDRNAGGNSPVRGYLALPPSALPEARRRCRRDLPAAAAMGGSGGEVDDFGNRRRANRRSRQVRLQFHCRKEI